MGRGEEFQQAHEVARAGNFIHVSHHEMKPGDTLLPATKTDKVGINVHISDGLRNERLVQPRVYGSRDMVTATSWAHDITQDHGVAHYYEVQPHGRVEEAGIPEWNDYELEGEKTTQLIARHGTVVRKLATWTADDVGNQTWDGPAEEKPPWAKQVKR